MESGLAENVISQEFRRRPRLTTHAMNAFKPLQMDQRGDVAPHPSRDRLTRSDHRQRAQAEIRLYHGQPRGGANETIAVQSQCAPMPEGAQLFIGPLPAAAFETVMHE